MRTGSARVFGLVVAVTLVLSAACADEAAPARPADRCADSFLIGVWQQPAPLFELYRRIGVNTAVAVPDGVERRQWSADADRAGLLTIPQLTSSEPAEARRPGFCAWLLPDEPDLTLGALPKLGPERETGRRTTPEANQMVNFSGGVMAGLQLSPSIPRTDADAYRSLVGDASIVAADIYPVSGWGAPDWIDLRRGPTKAGLLLDRLNGIAPGRRKVLFVEAGPQTPPYAPSLPGPSPEQVRGQIWDAVAGGATGVVFFTIGFTPFRWSTMTPGVATAISDSTRDIRAHQDCLLGPSSREAAPVPIEQTVFRCRSGGSMRLALNMSPVPTTHLGRPYAAFEYSLTRL